MRACTRLVVAVALFAGIVAVARGGGPFDDPFDNSGSNNTVAAAGTGPLITPVTPGRVFESRRGPGLGTVDGEQAGAGRRAAGQVTEIQITGRAGVPEGAIGVAANVTIVRPDRNGFATVFPCDETRPGSSTINYSANQVVANGAIVKLSASGTVCVFVLRATDLVVDVTGFAGADSPLGIVSPARFFDSRPGEPTVDGRQAGEGRRRAGQVTTVQITGREGIPDDAIAVVLNATAIRPDRQGFVTVFPCGSPQPTASTLNPAAGTVVANGAIVQIGDGGTVCVVSNRAFDLAIDVTGFVPKSGGFGSLNPARLYETRPAPNTTIDGDFWIQTRALAQSRAEVEIPVRPGVPIDIDAATLNITAIRPSAQGFITVYPCGEDRPNASTLNFRAGQVVANSVIVQPGEFGRVCIYVSQEMDLIVDITGYTTTTTTAVDVNVGFRLACSARSDGSVWCGGRGNPAFVDDPGASFGPGAEPRPVPGVTDAVATATGNKHACALRRNGQVVCWGDNIAGQLGNGTTQNSARPVAVAGLTDAVAIGAGALHTCAVREGGSAVCWGLNHSGELGNGTRLEPQGVGDTRGSSTPQPVVGLTDVEAIDLGQNHTCARRASGVVSCWGSNQSNTLARDDDLSFSVVPLDVPGITTATSLGVGDKHTCVSVQDGTARCWGRNSQGELGAGSALPFNVATPVAPSGLNNVAEISSGVSHSCARRSDGTIWCWGRGASLQLGQGYDPTEKSTPVRVERITTAVEIASGGANSCARLVNGRIQCWGDSSSDVVKPTQPWDGPGPRGGFGTPVTSVFR